MKTLLLLAMMDRLHLVVEKGILLPMPSQVIKTLVSFDHCIEPLGCVPIRCPCECSTLMMLYCCVGRGVCGGFRSGRMRIPKAPISQAQPPCTSCSPSHHQPHTPQRSSLFLIMPVISAISILVAQITGHTFHSGSIFCRSLCYTVAYGLQEFTQLLLQLTSTLKTNTGQIPECISGLITWNNFRISQWLLWICKCPTLACSKGLEGILPVGSSASTSASSKTQITFTRWTATQGKFGLKPTEVAAVIS